MPQSTYRRMDGRRTQILNPNRDGCRVRLVAGPELLSYGQMSAEQSVGRRAADRVVPEVNVDRQTKSIHTSTRTINPAKADQRANIFHLHLDREILQIPKAGSAEELDT